MEFIVFVMCLPILIPLWILYFIFMVNYKPRRGRKRVYHDYDDYKYSSHDDHEEHDDSSIYDSFQDGTCSKSYMDLLMEDDDIRDEFDGEY